MNKIIHFILIFFSIFFYEKSRSQNDTYFFRNITIEQGLSNNTVYDILQDSNGFMWFATREGVCRFNGYEFETINYFPNTRNSLSNNIVLSLIEDENKQIWMGTAGGLDIYNMITEKISHKSEFEGQTIHKLYKNSKNKIWISCSDSNLNIVDKNIIKKEKIQPLDIKEHNQIIYVSSLSDTLYVFTNLKITEKIILSKYIPQLTKNSVKKCLYIDKNDNIWVGTKGYGAICINLKTKEAKTYSTANGLKSNIVFDFLQKDSSHIWLGTDGGGIHILDLKSQKWTYLQHNGNNNNLTSNAIYKLYLDNQNIVWIGTYSAGISSYYPTQKFSPIRNNPNNQNSISHNKVLSFAESQSGSILIGTDGGGLNLWNSKENIFVNYKHNETDKNSISSNVVKSMLIDRKNNVWLGTYNAGLNVLKENSEKFIHFKHEASNTNSIGHNNIWDIVEDSESNIWLALHGGGLDKFIPDENRFVHYTYQTVNHSSLRSNNCVDLMLDSKNRLWIGTGDKGASVLNLQTNTFEHFYHIPNQNNSLSHNDVRSIFEDQNQNIWLGTEGGGLNLYDEKSKTFRIFTIQNGLPNNSIHHIIQDNNNNLWLSTNKGLCKMNINTYVCSNYDSGDGLQSNEFIAGSGIKLSDGSICFGGSNGFNKFEPNKIMENAIFPKVFIHDFKIFNKSIQPNDTNKMNKSILYTDTIYLKYVENVFSLSFVGINYINTSKNFYIYKLEGFDKDWSKPSTKNEVNYTNLSPGTYIFKVKSSNNSENWTNESKNLSIIITPPFYMTLWFKFLMGFTILLAVYVYVRNRINAINQHREELAKEVKIKTSEIFQQKEEIATQRDKILEMVEKERESTNYKMRFFTNISHELRTPLTLISAPLDKILEISENKTITMLSQMIQRNANRLLMMINQLMDFKKNEIGELKFQPQMGNIVNTVQETIETFQNLAENNDVDLIFKSDYDSIIIEYDKPKIETILYNLLSNAFKFTTTGGKIEVNTKISQNQLVLSISDTGVGIPETEKDKIFERFYQSEYTQKTNSLGTGIGLSLVKDFVEMHHGTIDIQSIPNIGTTFVLTFPDAKGNQENFRLEKKYSRESSIQNVNKIDEEQPLMLIVDDNTDIRNIIKTEFQSEYQIVEATNGLEGVEAANKWIPDIIISDVMMPQMDGFTFTKIVKNADITCHIPVLLLTARSSEDAQLEGLETKADDYVTKPFRNSILRARINSLIQNRKLLKNKYSSENSKEKLISIAQIEDKTLKRTLEIIEENYEDSDFGTSQLADKMNMSRTQLYRKIKAVTNDTVNELIRNFRLKKSVILMLNEGLNINETAYKTGFSTPSYFSKCFSDYFGASPKDYIENLLKNKSQ